MEEEIINPKEICRLGTDIEKLFEYTKDTSLTLSRTIDLLEPIHNSSGITKKLKKIKKGAKDWQDRLKTKLKGKGKGATPESTLPEQLRDNLRDDAHEWKIQFENTVSNFFIAIPEIDLPVKKLRKGPEAFLSKKTSKKLTDTQARNLKEACDSLLAGNCTASEYMALRVAASMLKEWYEERPVGEISGSWDTILTKLGNEYPKKKPRELKSLDYLLERKNEVMNLSKISSQSDAESTLRYTFNLAEKVKKVHKSGTF
ncbi:hypothetical protein AKJ43_03895 [candidate division MSBL1 archaeon SCGC-AAA261D19]|uniref:Uncharacterized protein n=1 Tax=candidate division MSBL1 archaeon SCGC-AAA261D19 TaxID=1698273 RepID=A0A133V2Z6_9EURY|nr:hypothetical protein AKJ43_03895 [candidate division MSBL1 archaeon SCGC-AAA261D19]